MEIKETITQGQNFFLWLREFRAAKVHRGEKLPQRKFRAAKLPQGKIPFGKDACGEITR